MKRDTKESERIISIIQAWVQGRDVQTQALGEFGEVWKDFGKGSIPAWNWGEFDYRIKPLEFPPLPDGLRYHNPEAVPIEQFPAGFRPAVEGELQPPGYKYWSAPSWHDGFNFTSRVFTEANSKTSVCVPLSTPFPEPPKKPVRVPLGPEDVPPGSVFRMKEGPDDHWAAPSQVNPRGVTFALTNGGEESVLLKTWEKAKDVYLIKRPGEGWKPCEKESP